MDDWCDIQQERHTCGHESGTIPAGPRLTSCQPRKFLSTRLSLEILAAQFCRVYNLHIALFASRRL